MNKNTLYSLAVGLAFGVLLGSSVIYFSLSNGIDKSSGTENSGQQKNEILYWVAPMDPNFQRDKPGKSPMGMNLVPVYANEKSSPGTVTISPVTIQNLGVKTATVAKTVPSSRLNLFGQAHYANARIIHIHPRVAGWVEKLNVRSKGDFIEEGEALYSLYSPDLVNAQEEYLLALQQGSKVLIDAARSRLNSLNAPQNLIEKINKNRAIMRTITYFAPQSGYVSELNIQEGFYVTPSMTLLAIANMDSIWVLVDIFAIDASKVALGSRVQIENPYVEGNYYTSIIDYIYPSVSTNTRTLKARTTLSNEDHKIKPGMYLDVLLDSLVDDKAILTVPKSAVIRTGESDRAVLALGEGRYKSINIDIGRAFEEEYEVLNGLYEGDMIVTSAQFLLDSESSISSDFERMESPSQEAEIPQEDIKLSAWTHATINEIVISERLVNLTHGPLDEFDMMGMTMNFMVADDINMNKLSAGQEIHVEIVKLPSGMYKVKTVHFMDGDMPAHDELSGGGQ